MVGRLVCTVAAIGAAVLPASAAMSAVRWKAQTLQVLPPPDRVALAALPAAELAWPFRVALADGTAGTMDDYHAFGFGWGFGLEEVALPVTCCQGEADTLVSWVHARHLVEHLPDARLEPVAGAAHFVMLGHGGDVFAALRAVLEA